MWESLNLDSVLTFVGGAIAALLALWATRIKARSEEEISLPTGWRDLTGEIKSWYAHQLDYLEEKVVEAKAELQVREDYSAYIYRRINDVEEWGRENSVDPPEILSFGEWRSRP